MFDEQWQFAVEVERKYNQYRRNYPLWTGLPESVWRIVVFRNFQRRQGRISQIMRADSEERDGKIKTLKAREKNIIEK